MKFGLRIARTPCAPGRDVDAEPTHTAEESPVAASITALRSKATVKMTTILPARELPTSASEEIHNRPGRQDCPLPLMTRYDTAQHQMTLPPILRARFR